MTTTNDTLQEIEELQQRCEQYEGISLKLNWDMLRRKPEEGGAEWLVTYEDEQLIGFIGLYGITSEMEVCGMVRPGYRRRGIFTGLWKRALTIIERSKPGIVLLNTPANSASAAAFLKTLPHAFNHSEFQMKWNGILPEADAVRNDVVLRPASPEEIPFMVRMDCEGFGDTEEHAAAMYDQRLSGDNEEYILIESGGSPAGKLRLSTQDNETWIYGFAVDARLRGRGIGRSALLQTIEREHRNGNSVHLEVALDNPNALKLYESCGFAVQGQQDYYRYIG